MSRSPLALLPALGLSLLACDDSARIQSGSWTLQEAWSVGTQLDQATRPVGSMVVDAEAGMVDLFDGEDALIASVAMLSRPKADWPSDCPTNFSATRMEIADLEVEELDLGGLVVVAPALMAECPSGDTLKLFADDTEAQGLAACAESSACAGYG